jgi:Holliday junction resolvasome RuvABC endonuclease subunit
MPKKKKLTKEEKEQTLNTNSKILRKILKRKSSVIGLDLSTTSTGFYNYHFSNENLRFGTTIKGGKNQINKRIVNILDSIDELLVSNKNSIAIIEDYSFGLRGSSLSQLAELGGCVRTTLLRSGICYLTLSPQTLKKFVLGPSRGSNTGKEFMLMQALDRWGQKFNTSDVCDAFCLTQFVVTLREYMMPGSSGAKWQNQMYDDFIINRGLPISL